jgi:hypothetical protein
MANYKASLKLYQTVLQEYWEDFDTENQEQWDSLKERIRSSDSDYANSLPEDAPQDPEIWFEAYKELYYAEYENQEDDYWISDAKGSTEYQYDFFDADGNTVDT